MIVRLTDGEFFPNFFIVGENLLDRVEVSLCDLRAELEKKHVVRFGRAAGHFDSTWELDPMNYSRALTGSALASLSRSDPIRSAFGNGRFS